MGPSSHSLHCSPVCLLGLFVTLEKSSDSAEKPSQWFMAWQSQGWRRVVGGFRVAPHVRERQWGLCPHRRAQITEFQTGSEEHSSAPWPEFLTCPHTVPGSASRGTSRAPSASSLPFFGPLRSLTQLSLDSKYYCTFAKEISVPPSPHNQTKNYCLFGYFAAFCSVL